ncbi:MAG: dethiobiotin synthase [Chthoniobacteraceae bacterium]|nr:dethiobiotin synthase [Chthoniobacteraceae bacterium]
MNLFVTGIDTDAGKTYVSALLVRALRRAGLDTVPMKPFCCGSRGDAEVLRAACGNALPLDTINPVSYASPTAPYTAAKLEHRPADMSLVMETFRRLRAEHRSVLVEGVGGWMVPLTRDYFVADLAAEMGLPVALVVRNRLGALNHALLTVRDIERRGLPFAGIIFNRAEAENDPAAATNRELLEELLGRPVLFEVAPGQTELPASALATLLSGF